MAHVVAIANQKGGVGKTTSAVSISSQLALLGFRVLLLDFDPQCSATSGSGAARHPEGNDLYDLFFGRTTLAALTVPSAVTRLSVVPGSADLVSLELEIGKTPGRELILKSALHSVEEQYDVVLIDCPPSSGLLTLNALGAAESVLIPLQAEYYSLEGLSALMNTIQFVQQTFNPRLSVLGVFLSMFDARTNLSLQVLDEAQKFFGDKLFKTRVPRNVKLSECPSYGQPICIYDPQSAGSKAYLALTAEVIERLDLNGTGGAAKAA
jgi:chromosome partitioning protein